MKLSTLSLIIILTIFLHTVSSGVIHPRQSDIQTDPNDPNPNDPNDPNSDPQGQSNNPPSNTDDQNVNTGNNGNPPSTNDDLNTGSNGSTNPQEPEPTTDDVYTLDVYYATYYYSDIETGTAIAEIAESEPTDDSHDSSDTPQSTCIPYNIRGFDLALTDSLDSVTPNGRIQSSDSSITWTLPLPTQQQPNFASLPIQLYKNTSVSFNASTLKYLEINLSASEDYIVGSLFDIYLSIADHETPYYSSPQIFTCSSSSFSTVKIGTVAVTSSYASEITTSLKLTQLGDKLQCVSAVVVQLSPSVQPPQSQSGTISVSISRVSFNCDSDQTCAPITVNDFTTQDEIQDASSLNSPVLTPYYNSLGGVCGTDSGEFTILPDAKIGKWTPNYKFSKWSSDLFPTTLETKCFKGVIDTAPYLSIGLVSAAFNVVLEVRVSFGCGDEDNFQLKISEITVPQERRWFTYDLRDWVNSLKSGMVGGDDVWSDVKRVSVVLVSDVEQGLLDNGVWITGVKVECSPVEM